MALHIGWLAGTEPSTIYVPQELDAGRRLNLDEVEAQDTSQAIETGMEFVPRGG